MNFKEIKVCFVCVDKAALPVFYPHGSLLCLKKMIACCGMFTGEREVVSYQYPHTSQKVLSLFKLYLQKIDLHQCL